MTAVPEPPTPGDGNGDGWVDGLDYLLWAGAYGTHPATPTATSAMVITTF
ncbi:MAG: hypothetical protein R3C10_23620 [Pirellulales bacterium]